MSQISNVIESSVPLRQRIMHAGRWTMLGHAGSQVLRLGSSLIMTRLLVPEMFGIMALITAIMVLVTLLSDVGIRQALVYSERGDSAAMRSTAWAMQIVRGFAIWGICLAAAAVIWFLQVHGNLAPGSVYASQGLPIYIASATLVSVMNGFDSTKLYMADRTLDARSVAKIEVLSQLIGITVMVLIALYEKTIWALIVGSWISAFVVLVLSHWMISGPADRWGWDKGCAKEIIAFGRWILMSSALFALAGNMDRLILGGLLSPSELAFYQIAFMLIFTTESAIHRIISGVATPALSEVRRSDPSRLASVYWKFRRPIDLASMGSSGFLFAVSPLVIGFLYSDSWRPAAPIMAILSLSLALSRYGITNALCLATGNAKYPSFLSLVRTLSLLGGIPLGYALAGVTGCYWAVALHAVLTLPLYFYYQHKLGVQDWSREALALLIWPIAYGAGWAVMQIAQRLVPHWIAH